MKKILLGFAAIATLIGTPALAADMPLKAPPPPAPVMNWTGFYFGLEGGGGFAETKQSNSTGVTSNTYSQAGGLFGVTGGYNWQFGNWVAGVEADWSWTDINGSVSVVPCGAGGGTVCFTNMHWLTTERARLGVLVANNMLLYVTGGAAGSEIRAGQVSCATPIAGAIASCGTRTEWAPTGGLGVEAMFTPHWSAKVEWLYTGFGTHPFYTVMIPVNVKEDNVNIIRAGINWHWN